MKRTTFALMLLLVASTVPAVAGVTVAESQVLDRWTIQVGGFFSGLSTDLRVDSKVGDRGTTINLEDDLGFESSQFLPRIDLSYILGQRHQIDVGYYESKRDSTVTLSETIKWEDIEFDVNLTVRGFYDTSFFNLGYTYWFYSSETTALGVGGSAVLLSLDTGIEAGIQVGNPVDLAVDLSTSAPIGQLGFSVYHALPRRFVLKGRAVYISFDDIDGYSGSIASAKAGVEHRTWKNFGFGLTYNYTDYDIDTDSIDFLGNFGYNISGFEFYFRAAL